MPKKSFLPIVRELVRCYQAFEAHSAQHIRSMGLTPPQFDIVATLGNTEGMSFKELGEKTLITKGTLTGVIDRLEEKGLVERWGDADDGRIIIVALTRAGDRLFQREYPRYVEKLRTQFEGLSARDREQATSHLGQIADLF